MAYFLNEEAVKSAYEDLTNCEIENSSILHIFFILKACGFTRDAYRAVTDISSFGYAPAHAISSLFSPEEKHPPKFDFISPFSMQKWESQSPSEPLKKWVGGRIKNNVIGGATTWRRIIVDDPDTATLKFKYNYLDEIKTITLKQNKINIFAIAIWAFRFSGFEKKLTLVELANLFKQEFNITLDESNALFTSLSKKVKVSYDDTVHDASSIRQLIGPPNGLGNEWIEPHPEILSRNDPRLVRETAISLLVTQQVNMIQIIKDLLTRNNQIILAGPPGTSKSYFAKAISKEVYMANNVVSIQFHPKYSYQDFIGGYVVKGQEVKYEDGVLYNLAITAKENPNSEYLLIIDEINRANVGQVFGETIQCLDRGYEIQLLRDQKLEAFSLPMNLKIIATMNTSDRSIGAIDFAIKRRFPQVYCPPSPDLVAEHCQAECGISLSDLLRKINLRLHTVLKNKELVIGHALFMPSSLLKDKKFMWSNYDLEMLFNYQLLPLLDDFTKGNTSQLVNILDENLVKLLHGDNFISKLEDYVLNEN